VPKKGRPPGLEPSSDAEDVSFYCTSDDFPARTEARPVCHYSTRRGYQTFCIPEADSEILRFYSMITADLASAVTAELRQRKL
jgi:hypothetical protein